MYLSKFSVQVSKTSSLLRNYYTKKCTSDGVPDNLITTLIGAASPLGRMTSLLLKQNCYIDELRLYDKSEESCGIALDLSHIDTNTKVQAYAGRQVLPEAIQVLHLNYISMHVNKSYFSRTHILS